MNGFKGDTVDPDDLTYLKNHFVDDFDMNELLMELHVIRNKANAICVKNMRKCLALVQGMSDGAKDMIPNIVKAFRLYIVLPCSTASAERSFSKLRRIKNYLRSTMAQPRLNHLLLLHTYKEKLDLIPTISILAKEVRQRTFALPK